MIISASAREMIAMNELHSLQEMTPTANQLLMFPKKSSVFRLLQEVKAVIPVFDIGGRLSLDQ